LAQRAGKTTAQADRYDGYFAELVPNERIVEVNEFGTGDSEFQGKLSSMIALSDKDGGTEVVGLHEGLPPRVLSADNETPHGVFLAARRARPPSKFWRRQPSGL
jgi:hypothetical protein